MKKKSKNISTRGSTMDRAFYAFQRRMVDVRWFDHEFAHESLSMTIIVRYCHTCGNVGTIIVDFAPGIGMAGRINCPDCGDGERVDG